ncbi:unnamed protein product [Rotaria socialis]|nr:unnamed protein product [Rotaria socialis]
MSANGWVNYDQVNTTDLATMLANAQKVMHLAAPATDVTESVLPDPAVSGGNGSGNIPRTAITDPNASTTGLGLGPNNGTQPLGTAKPGLNPQNKGDGSSSDTTKNLRKSLANSKITNLGPPNPIQVQTTSSNGTQSSTGIHYTQDQWSNFWSNNQSALQKLMQNAFISNPPASSVATAAPPALNITTNPLLNAPIGPQQYLNSIAQANQLNHQQFLNNQAQNNAIGLQQINPPQQNNVITQVDQSQKIIDLQQQRIDQLQLALATGQKAMKSKKRSVYPKKSVLKPMQVNTASILRSQQPIMQQNNPLVNQSVGLQQFNTVQVPIQSVLNPILNVAQPPPPLNLSVYNSGTQPPTMSALNATGTAASPSYIYNNLRYNEILTFCEAQSFYDFHKLISNCDSYLHRAMKVPNYNRNKKIDYQKEYHGDCMTSFINFIYEFHEFALESLNNNDYSYIADLSKKVKDSILRDALHTGSEFSSYPQFLKHLIYFLIAKGVQMNTNSIRRYELIKKKNDETNFQFCTRLRSAWAVAYPKDKHSYNTNLINRCIAGLDDEMRAIVEDEVARFENMRSTCSFEQMNNWDSYEQAI